jgi:hypothetical protein
MHAACLTTERETAVLERLLLPGRVCTCRFPETSKLGLDSWPADVEASRFGPPGSVPQFYLFYLVRDVVRGIQALLFNVMREVSVEYRVATVMRWFPRQTCAIGKENS